MNVERLLIAERGPMAAHLIDVYETMGIETVAICDLDDPEDAPHLERASFVTLVPRGAPPRALIDAANDAGCDGLHPGLGPLAEDAAFARLVGASNLLYVGAAAPLVERLADRWSTRLAALSAKVPVVPGTELLGPSAPLHDAVMRMGKRVGFPIWLKSAAGRQPERLDDAIQAENRLRERVLGGERVWLETHVREARHVVVTVVGDAAGTALALGPRGRVRRRGGRLTIDQFPASIHSGLAASLNNAAEAMVKALSFRGVGSVGFLVDPSGGAWCLGLRPRLQLGTLLIDALHQVRLPEVQLRIATGDRVGWGREQLGGQGVALGIRVRAKGEGRLSRWAPPAGASTYSVVAEGGRAEGLLAVLVVQAPTRQACVVRASAALRAMRVEGVETDIPDHLAELGDPGFWADRVQVVDPDTEGSAD